MLNERFSSPHTIDRAKLESAVKAACAKQRKGPAQISPVCEDLGNGAVESHTPQIETIVCGFSRRDNGNSECKTTI